MKRMDTKTILGLLKKNNLFKITILVSITIVSSILYNWFDWAYWPMIIATGCLALYGALYIIHAFIVNPIKYLIKKFIK